MELGFLQWANILQCGIRCRQAKPKYFITRCFHYERAPDFPISRFYPPFSRSVPSGVLKLRALSRTISKNAIPEGCDYYFDTKGDEEEWRTEYLFFHILISLWHTDLSDVVARWVGIILCATRREGLEEFRRVGLAIGPDQEVATENSKGLKIKGWTRKDFTII